VQLVLGPPVPTDHGETQEEGQQLGPVVAEEGADAMGPDSAHRVDQGENQEGDGDGHDGVAEGHQPPKTCIARHGQVSHGSVVPRSGR
jgi:hypothetical protein